MYRRHYKAAHNDLLKPFDGISELLQRLNRAGVRIGVVSSKKADYLQLGLEALGLDRWVVLLVGADETESHKPAPDRCCSPPSSSAPIRRTASTSGTRSLTSRPDRQQARTRSASPWGASSRADLVAAAPTVVVDTTSELLERLLSYP